MNLSQRRTEESQGQQELDKQDRAPTLVTRDAWLARAYNRLSGTIAQHGWPLRYALALFSTMLVTAVMALSGLPLEPANISLIYLLAVLFTATTAGVGQACSLRS